MTAESSEILALNFFTATVRLSGDLPKRIPVDAVCVPGRARGDRDHVLSTAVRLVLNGQAKYVVITNTEGEVLDGTKAWPGKTAWTTALVNRFGLRPDVFRYPSAPSYHTLHEAEHYLQLATIESWSKLAIVAQPHQGVRIMLGIVGVITKNPDLYKQVYFHSPITTSWRRAVYGSQGQNLKPRSEHIKEEFDRIIRYQAKGDLATFEQLFHYLDGRTSSN